MAGKQIDLLRARFTFWCWRWRYPLQAGVSHRIASDPPARVFKVNLALCSRPCTVWKRRAGSAVRVSQRTTAGQSTTASPQPVWRSRGRTEDQRIPAITR